MQKNFSHQSGFSLLELIVATTIIGMITMISTSAYTGYIETTKISQTISQIRTLSLLIDNYALDNDKYPESLSDIGNENLKDPWGNPYTYVNLKNNNNQDDSEHHSEHHDGGNDTNISAARKDGNLVPINTNYDLCSSGKDGKSKAPLRAKDSHDDVIYANDGGYIGLASEF
ncbi:MAG: prepilin-type N-terminal cleavage/methylation domain-containing protein [Gammaproteobacteria bacterium]|nr:prepilin-type N-terminal cleavage/methylation domain-containing protein [Gammaproteobacteria bacterium]